MLQWALLFFIVAVVAALLGLRGVAGLSAEVGYVLAVLAVVFLLIAMVSRAFAAMPPTPSQIGAGLQAAVHDAMLINEPRTLDGCIVGPSAQR
jgi:uncharacterized membrane protein YtjA (UPF0391 family)